MTDDTDLGLAIVPRPIEAGPEMTELARFFFDCVWIGTVDRSEMGAPIQEMLALGQGRHERIQAARWIVGTFVRHQFARDGTRILTWELHLVMGWSPAYGEYRATSTDNYGRADVLRGHVTGDRLVFETIGAQPVRVRLVWDVTDPANMTWRRYLSVHGGPWSSVERWHLTAIDQHY
jgi:hypothetical protein